MSDRPKPHVYKLANINAWAIDWTDQYGVDQQAIRVHWPVAIEMALRTWQR